MRRFCAIILAAGALSAILFGGAVEAADRLILRNLDIVTGRTVVSFDEDGVVLDAPRPGGSERVTWDEIERGRVALDQPRFDALLRELGPSLFRIRQRLKFGDYAALGEPAEAMYPRFAERQSQTAYLVCQATMWSRIAAGRREAAVVPYVRCFELLRWRAATIGGLPGDRRLTTDAKLGLSPELVPVWFNPDAAKAALPELQAVIRGLRAPRPEGIYVYYASLALAAGEAAEAERVTKLIVSDEPQLAAWRDLLAAQQEVQAGAASAATSALREKLPAMPAACRPAALYWVGITDIQSSEEELCRDGILSLLSLPAEYGEQHRELAAAGLYRAAEALAKLKDERGAAAVRGELSSRYGDTQHARQLAARTR